VTDQTNRLRAVLTVTVETRVDGDYYTGQPDLIRHVTRWVEEALYDRDDIESVTVGDRDAELMRAQAEAYQYRTALQGAARRAPAGPAPATERSAVLLEAADCAYRIARRLDDQHHDQRAQGAWDVENVLRAELRRMAGEAQQDGCGPACLEQHTYGDHCEAQQDPTQDVAPEARAAIRAEAFREAAEAVSGMDTDPGTQFAAEQLHRMAAVARSGQPETEARCPDAVWTPTPHPPHTWNQSPTHPQRPCPGVPEKPGQPETDEEARS
jgi:hypothetical protein